MRSERFTTPALNGIALNTLHRGDPSHTPVVLLHGGGANAHWWDALAPALAERFHVVALDFRGHGDSDHPDAREPGAFQHDLSALLAHLGDPRAAAAALARRISDAAGARRREYAADTRGRRGAGP